MKKQTPTYRSSSRLVFHLRLPHPERLKNKLQKQHEKVTKKLSAARFRLKIRVEFQALRVYSPGKKQEKLLL
jgi:hypothetical protein